MSETVLRLHPPPDEPATPDRSTVDWAGFAGRARMGDRGAFEELLRITARSVYARIFVQVGDMHRAEDIVQETYLLAWRRIGELREPEKFPGWLATISHTALLDAVRRERRKKRSKKREDASVLQGLAGDAQPPDASAEAREQECRAVAALNELPSEYREPLALRFLAGADYCEIETQLSLTNGALRGLLQRGMKLLRERL